ncbi:uncharacterized protein LOC110027614 [Phalaenopsis equestris]|uniref:uncharacterized protein LOC110027614 n=1 Tax=Phalaenopsis equestris TaxID=78828 RepID=UPI0009E5F334|nr:uncharacterized protein LOC110027614 [Phalaenopsis equestris]
MIDRSASPLVKYNPGVQTTNSSLDAENSNWNYLKRTSFFETGASTLNHLMPIINHLDIDALSNLSNSLCPAAKIGGVEYFLPSGIGYSLSNTQGEQTNFANKVESEEPA